MASWTVWGVISTGMPPAAGSPVACPGLEEAFSTGASSSGVWMNRFSPKLYSTATSTTQAMSTARMVRFLSSKSLPPSTLDSGPQPLPEKASGGRCARPKA